MAKNKPNKKPANKPQKTNTVPARPAGFNPSAGIVGNAVNMATAAAQAPAGGGDEVKDPWATSKITKQQAKDFATDMLKLWGLESLGVDVNKLVDDYGDNTALYEVGIRQTEGYQKRFKGLNDLRRAGNTYGITSEGEYLALENQYRNVFRQAGIGDRLTGTSGNDYESIADLISKYNQSVDEVQARIADAQRVVNDTSPDVKNALRDFYGIGDNDLLAYSLDPANAMADINRKANAATFAGLSRQAGLNVSQTYAETMAQNLYGTSDINRPEIQQSVQQASTLQRETSKLAGIEGTSLSAEESLSTTLGTDALATEKVKGLQSRERARFSGSSAIQQKTLRRGGI